MYAKCSEQLSRSPLRKRTCVLGGKKCHVLNGWSLVMINEMLRQEQNFLTLALMIQLLELLFRTSCTIQDTRTLATVCKREYALQTLCWISHFRPRFPFYTLWKQQKAGGFIISSRGVKREYFILKWDNLCHIIVLFI